MNIRHPNYRSGGASAMRAYKRTSSEQEVQVSDILYGVREKNRIKKEKRAKQNDKIQKPFAAVFAEYKFDWTTGQNLKKGSEKTQKNVLYIYSINTHTSLVPKTSTDEHTQRSWLSC